MRNALDSLNKAGYNLINFDYPLKEEQLEVNLIKANVNEKNILKEKTVYIFGDSHASVYEPGIRENLKFSKLKNITTAQGCAYMPKEQAMLINRINIFTLKVFRCSEYLEKVDRIVQNEIKSGDAIFLGIDWTKNGGTLITYKNSIDWLQSANIIDFNIIEQEISANDISYEDADNFYDAQKIGGAIFQTQLDLTHPINFGFTNEYMPIFRNSTIFLKPDNNKYKTPIKYTENPLLSGYISQNNLENLKNTTPIKITGFGDGNIIYLTDNTNFRAFWYGTNKVLMNAIFFADIIETNIN